jgi:uncharacterized repeat protein (TIGR02543 family)
MKKIISITLLAIFPLVMLTTCSDPWRGSGNMGSITVSVGGGNRAMWGGFDTDLLKHIITVTDSSGAVQDATVQPGGGSVIFTSLASGLCTILVQGWLGDELKTQGVSSVNIKPGQNGTVAVPMRLIEEDGVIYTVTFDSNGGSEVSDQNIGEGGMAIEPVAPTRSFAAAAGLYEGTTKELSYTFTGWYIDDSLYDFNAAVSGNITLTAGWTEPTSPIASIGANDVSAAISYVNTNAGTYTLVIDSDTDINTAAQTLAGVDLTIKGIGRERTIKLSTNGSLFTVGSGVTLTLDDRITLQGHKENYNSLVKVENGGILIMNEGAKITGNTITVLDSGTGGGGVYVNGGKFTMDGGEISNNATHSDNDSNVSGGGVYVNGGEFTMNNGTISMNTITCGVNAGGSTKGGGVYIGSGTFIMEGGKIYENIAGPYDSDSGGGVYVGGGTFTMKDGEISGNKTLYGGGVSVGGGTFTMEDGEISGNEAGYGGGVFVSEGTFIIDGGTISGNTASYGSGGGVYVGGGTFTKTGGTIYGCDNLSGNRSNKVVDDSGDIQNRKGHAVYARSYLSDLLMARIKDISSGPNDALSFCLDDDLPSWEGDWEAVILYDSYSFPFSNILEWLQTNAVSNTDYFIELTNPQAQSISPQTLSYSGRTNIGITPIGPYGTITISFSEPTGSLFTVGNGVTLTLDNGITLQGYSGTNLDALVKIESGGILFMNTGSKITGHSPSSTGGGVHVNGGTFTMNGGEISDNKSSDNTSIGGGVYVANSGNFTMNDGKISGNEASQGGGVYIAGNGTLKIVTGTIYGSDETDADLKNTASGEGAALYKAEGATAQYGKDTTWTDLATTDETIKVEDGRR